MPRRSLKIPFPLVVIGVSPRFTRFIARETAGMHRRMSEMEA
jgi:hypothetical protein